MKNTFYILIVSLLIFASCSSEDEIFDRPSSERIESLFAEYNELLLDSPNGWKMKYFPNPQRIGGFNFLFKFEENNRVKMLCDFRESEEVSSYKFYAGQGAVLSFDTYNFLHVLADPQFFPTGTGLEGDYELVVERVTSDSIICNGRKWKQPMILTRASAEDWSEMDKLKDNDEVLAPIQENVPFFRNLRINGEGIATFLYEQTERFIEYYYNDEDGNTKSGKVGVIFSREGFSLHTEIDVNGVLLKDFVFDENTGGFTFGESGNLVMEHFSTVVFKDAWDKFYEKEGAYLIRSSKDFFNLFGEVRALEPELESLQVYWNVQNYKLLSFFFVKEEEESMVPYWFHSLIGDIDSPGEDCAIFKQAIDQNTQRPIYFAGDAGMDAEMNRLFYQDNPSSRKLKEIIDIFYNTDGFTIIPADDGTFYMISKSSSNYWLMFKTF